MQKSLLITGAALGCLLLGAIGLAAAINSPWDVAVVGRRLDIAMAGFHQIWGLDLDTVEAQPLAGSGRPGLKDGQMAEFYEPGGLSLAGAKLYIEDTNNHAIRVADLASGEVSTPDLTGLAIPDAVAGFEGLAWMDGEVIDVPLQTIKAGAKGQLVVTFELPTGYKLNPAASVNYAVYVRGDGIQVPNSGRPLSAHAIEFPLTIPFQASPGTHRAALDIEATFYWCREDNTRVCMIQPTRWHVPVEASETEENRLLTVSTTAQLRDEVGSPLSPTAPLKYKGDGK